MEDKSVLYIQLLEDFIYTILKKKWKWIYFKVFCNFLIARIFAAVSYVTTSVY